MPPIELAEKAEPIRKYGRDRQTERRINTKPEPHRTLNDLITRQDAPRAQGKVKRHNRIAARPHDRRNITNCQFHGCFSELGASVCS